MSADQEYSFHLIDEREFRERFLPAVQGEEPIVREMLEAADASGPSWTALHKLFDDTRVEWQRAVELGDGELAQRTLFAGFAQLVTHLRPAYCVRGFSLSDLEYDFPELLSMVRSPGVLLRDPDGRSLPGVPDGFGERIPRRCLQGRSSGGMIRKDDVRGFLEAVREALPRLAERLGEKGLAAEPAITILLTALVEAKLQGYGILEAAEALTTDTHLPNEHKVSVETPDLLPPAVVREAAAVFGKELPPPAAEEEAEEPPAPPLEAVPYTPAGTYDVGQFLQHKSFGRGEVLEVLDSRRVRVRFENEEKTLVQGLAPAKKPGADEAPAEEPAEAAEEA